jgi:hypothetical protein
MLSTDESPGRLGPAADVPPNDLRKDGVRFCRDRGVGPLARNDRISWVLSRRGCERGACRGGARLCGIRGVQAGFRPQAEIMGEVARSRSPAATLSRCWSTSSSVAKPAVISRSRICVHTASLVHHEHPLNGQLHHRRGDPRAARARTSRPELLRDWKRRGLVTARSRRIHTLVALRFVACLVRYVRMWRIVVGGGVRRCLRVGW